MFICVCRCYYFCIGFSRLFTTIAFKSCSFVYVVAIIFASAFHDFSRRFLLSRALSCMSLLLFLHRLSTTFHDSCFLVVFSCVCRCYYFCIDFPRLSTIVSFRLCLVVYVVAIIQHRLFTTYLLINRIVFVIVKK